VRLGVVLVSSGDLVITGREPLLDSRPPEFENVSAVTLELSANWVDNMLKDVMEVEEAEQWLARLNARWPWNLYLIRPATIPAAVGEPNLVVLAKKMYQKFVGEPFKEDAHARRPRQGVRRPVWHAVLPPAWVFAENMRIRFTPLAATA
jgi:hypothetical protein